MRVLLINELYQMGGAEVQTLREIDVLRKHGHEVYHITFDAKLEEGWENQQYLHYNFLPENLAVQNWHLKRVKRFFSDKTLKNKVKALISEINPDVIHINNMTYKPVTIYGAMVGWKTLQTIRDFSVICPNELCVDKEYHACVGYKYGKCVEKCANHSKKQYSLYFYLDKLYLKRINQVRQKYISAFVCPSQYLTDACNANGFQIKCLNNSFDFTALNSFEKQDITRKKIYMAYGLIAKHKGILQLVDAFKVFAEERNVELRIVGKIASGFEQELESNIQDSTCIHYLGAMNYVDIIRCLQDVYAVIVPSLWLENYPNTALEGLATKCLVIGTDRGGIPELVNNENLVFNVLNRNSIVEKLIYSYELASEQYKKIIEENYLRVTANNNLDIYYQRLIRIFEELRHR